MHIVLFGGAFDPPHLGHIAVAKNFIQLGLSDQLVFLPVLNHAFDKNLTSSYHRLEMLKKVKDVHFHDQPVYISDFELQQNEKISVTYETLTRLSKQNPHNQYSFLIGSDNLKHFHKWHHYQEMLDTYRVYVYPRAGFDFEKLRPGMIALYNMPKMEVSSTQVRERLHNNELPQELLSPEVQEYISKEHLY